LPLYLQFQLIFIQLEIDRLRLLQEKTKCQYPFEIFFSDGKEHIHTQGRDYFYQAYGFLCDLERIIRDMPRIMIDTHISFTKQFNMLRRTWAQAQNCLESEAVPSAEAMFRFLTDEIIKFADLCVKEMNKVDYKDELSGG